MAEFLRIETTGADELREALQRAISRIDRPAELMDRLAARLQHLRHDPEHRAAQARLGCC